MSFDRISWHVKQQKGFVVIRFLALLCVSLGAHAASFDCKKSATPVEALICSDASLSQLDETLALVYENEQSKPAGQESLKAEQRAWLASRNKCKDASCLQLTYARRTLALGCANDSYILSEHECVRLELTVVEGELTHLQLQHERKVAVGSKAPPPTKRLIQAEARTWHDERDAKCDLYGAREGGTSAWKSTWSGMCKITETKKRIEHLRKEIERK